MTTLTAHTRSPQATPTPVPDVVPGAQTVTIAHADISPAVYAWDWDGDLLLIPTGTNPVDVFARFLRDHQEG